MKDYSWLAVFSVFTLVVGILFTYGNGTNATTNTQPVQVFVTSTTTPAAPIVLGAATQTPNPQPITITFPEITLPVITVNVSIATSSLSGTGQTKVETEAQTASPSYTYYVTNNTTYTAPDTTATTTATTTDETAEEVFDTVTVSIQGIYEATTTPITAGQTVLELLTSLDVIDSELALTTQDYGDMGVLVTSMGGFENGMDGKYWQYLVNDVSPMVGADQYELQVGDTVLWEFTGF